MQDMFEKTILPSNLNDVDYEKLKFVEEKLAPMIFEATRGIVFSCEYMKSAMCPCECVAMKLQASVSGRVIDFRADVTGSSLYGIVKDVMRAVDRYF